MWSLIKSEDVPYLEQQFPQLQEYERQYILHEGDNGICFLPKFFADKFECDYIAKYTDPSFKPQPIEIEFTKELRPNQLPFIDAIDKTKKGDDIGGILQGYPGIGKTVIAAKIASIYKEKTLIILDNSKLMEQWISAFIEFTTITEDQIGIIKGPKLEIDKPIVIAMVQTLVSKAKRDLTNEYTKIKDAGFGLVVIDECHKSSSAPMFSKASLFFNTPNVIGLSATPYNQDLAALLMHGVMGEVLYKTTEYELVPDVYFVNYRSGLPSNKLKRLHYMRDMISRTATYNSIIVESMVYLDIIKKIVDKLVRSNHQTIVICSTIKQVDLIRDVLTIAGIDSEALCAKSAQIDETVDVIVATYAFAGAGFDLKTLSALVYASPYKGKKSTIQTIGRILRKSPNKNKAIVFDLVDKECDKVFAGHIKVKSNIINSEFGKCNITQLNM